MSRVDQRQTGYTTMQNKTKSNRAFQMVAANVPIKRLTKIINANVKIIDPYCV